MEDDPDSAHLVETAVQMAKTSFRIHFVQNGLEALDFLYQRDKFEGAPRPDLIILDLNLPLKSGDEVLKDMRNTPAFQSIPTVLLTATDYHFEMLKKFNLNKNCCYTKPDRFEKYIGLVTEIETLFWKGRLDPLP